jgi:hypothetical protein
MNILRFLDQKWIYNKNKKLQKIKKKLLLFNSKAIKFIDYIYS